MATISFEPLFQYIEQRSSLYLVDEEKILIQSAFRGKHLRKRQYLLQEGDVCINMAFVVSGSGRMFAVNIKGQESIIRFAIENWWLGDYESYNFGTPSLYNIEMLEDSDILVITKDQMQKLMNEVPAVKEMIRKIDSNAVVATQKRIHSSISLSAEERYDNLVKTYPDFLRRFPLSMIACYLGISPETLSRIRKNLLPRSPKSSSENK